MATDLAKLVVRLEAESGKLHKDLNRANRKISKFSRDTKRSLTSFESSIKKAGAALKGFVGAAAAGVAAKGIGNLSRAIAEAGDNMAVMRQKATSLTGSAGAFNAIVESSKKLGASLADVSSTFNRFALAGKDIGLTTEEVVKLNETVLQLGRLSGASAQELSAGSLQLAQALASGRLQGDELRSILENMPMLARTLAEQLGIGVGQLRELGSQGKLTAEVVSGALLRAATDVNDQFEKLPQTLAQSEARLGTEWTQLLGAMDDKLHQSDMWRFFSEELAETMRNIRIKMGGGSLGEMESKLAEAQARRMELATRGTGALGGHLADSLTLRKSLLDIEIRDLQIQIEGNKERTWRAQAAEDLNALVADEYKTEAGITLELDKQTDKIGERMQRMETARKKAARSALNASAAPWGAPAGTADRGPGAFATEAVSQYKDIQNAGEQAANAIGSAFATQASSALSGWGSLEDMLKNIAGSITSILIRTAVQKGVSSLFAPSANGNVFGSGGITPFAAGGVVNSPTMFAFAGGAGIMGEAGPEAVMPLKRGADGKLGVQATGQNIEIVKNGTPIRVSAESVPGGTRLTIDDMRAVDSYLGRQMATGGGTHYQGLQSAFQMTRRTL